MSFLPIKGLAVQVDNETDFAEVISFAFPDVIIDGRSFPGYHCVVHLDHAYPVLTKFSSLEGGVTALTFEEFKHNYILKEKTDLEVVEDIFDRYDRDLIELEKSCFNDPTKFAFQRAAVRTKHAKDVLKDIIAALQKMRPLVLVDQPEGENFAMHWDEDAQAWSRASYTDLVTVAKAQLGTVDGETSDGHHTFNELYDFRMAYNALLFNEWAAQDKFDVHLSYRHSDGELCFGKEDYFVVVANTPFGQISNHYKGKYRHLFNSVPERERAAEWDGHTPAEALWRMTQLAALGTVK